MDIKKLQEDTNERNFKETFKEECKILKHIYNVNTRFNNY